MPDLKLFVAPNTCARVATIALEEIGVPFDTSLVRTAANQQQSPEFLKLNPKGKVPTLLIDGDMRAPDIHQIFEIPLSAGLADVLDGKVALDDAINRSWSEHVHLLPAGELSKSPHKLLGSSALRILLEEARRNYRYVVIDTPPVLAASEALVIAKSSDRTIVCAMRDFSRESHVRMAHERLRSTGADTLGTVLNGVPVRSYAARYGSYGRYGYNNPSS